MKLTFGSLFIRPNVVYEQQRQAPQISFIPGFSRQTLIRTQLSRRTVGQTSLVSFAFVGEKSIAFSERLSLKHTQILPNCPSNPWILIQTTGFSKTASNLACSTVEGQRFVTLHCQATQTGTEADHTTPCTHCNAFICFGDMRGIHMLNLV